MKTNEEKLRVLLQIAVENGWYDKDDFVGVMDYYEVLTKQCLLYDDNHDIGVCYSLNDLICNWEKSEISFIEALCKDKKSNWGLSNFELSLKEVILYAQETYYYDLSESIRQQWTLQRTSQRLNWLFEIFNYLL